MIPGHVGQIVSIGSIATKIKNGNFRKPATIGFIVAILSSAFSALPDVIPKSLMNADTGLNTSPFLIVFFIYFFNTVVFTPLSKSKTKSSISKKILLMIIILGIVECSGTLFYTIGLKDTSAVNATILSNSETIFGIMIGLLVFRERLAKNEILPFALIFLGAVFFPITNDLSQHGLSFSNFVIGDAFILLAGALYCLDTFIIKHLDNSVNTRKIVQIMSVSACIFILCLILLLNIDFEIGLEQLSILSIIGPLGIGITTTFFIIALRLIGAVRTVLIYSTGTVFGIIYSIIFLSESVSLFDMGSVSLLLVGVFALRNKLGVMNG